MGFDACIIFNELGNAGLRDDQDRWKLVVGNGLCTMQPGICHWVRLQIGLWDKPRKIPMRLRDMMQAVLPEQAELLSDHHDAGTDAHMHMLLAQELHRRANLPARQ